MALKQLHVSQSSQTCPREKKDISLLMAHNNWLSYNLVN